LISAFKTSSFQENSLYSLIKNKNKIKSYFKELIDLVIGNLKLKVVVIGNFVLSF